MAALTADQLIDTKYVHSDPQGITQDYQVAASTTIYSGGFVGIDVTGGLVMASGCASAAAITGTRFVGVALEHVDNSAGLIAAKTCRVLIHGMVKYALTSAVVLDVGKPVFISDSSTITKVGAGNQFVGWITSFDTAGYVNVLISPFTQGQNSHWISGVSPIMDLLTLNDFGLIIPASANHNGLYVHSAYALVTTALVADTQAPIVTVEGTDGTDITTITGVDAQAISDFQLCATDGTPFMSANDKAHVPVPADYGVQAKVTAICTSAGTATGACKVFVTAWAL